MILPYVLFSGIGIGIHVTIPHYIRLFLHCFLVSLFVWSGLE